VLSARTIALDLVTHNIYLPACDTTQPSGGGRARTVGAAFKVLVDGPQWTRGGPDGRE
jgi:hypothetical protein